jgi:endonuclease III
VNEPVNTRKNSININQTKINKMRTTMKTFVMAFGIGLAIQANAQEANITVIDNPGYLAKMTTTSNSNVLKVYVGNILGQKLSVKLMDSNGNSLFNQYVNKREPQASINLDLSELPDGIYNVEMSDSNSKTVKSFKKGTEVIVTRPTETLVALN